MRRFTALFRALDRTTRTSAKVTALEGYFREAPPEDAAWALAALTGRRGRRPVSTADLRGWVAEAADLPLWLVEESYDAVGDLAETLALLLPERTSDRAPPPLHQVMEAWILPLRAMPPESRRAHLQEAWSHLDLDERFLFHKLLTGGFRVGVGARLVTRALSTVAGIPPSTLAHRLAGRWDPDAETYRRIITPGADLPDPGRPYPFMLAHPLEEGPEAEGLSSPSAWLVEWKWDGIRAQLLHRGGEVLLWSRGEDVITPSFPEVAEGGSALPSGTVLDGELLPWREGRPLPFGELQRRLGRTRPGRKILEEVPVVFLAYDLLEREGEDLRGLPLGERRTLLEDLWREAGAQAVPGPRAAPGARGPAPTLRISGSPLLLLPPLNPRDWGEAGAWREEARDRGVEGLMLKNREGRYEGGRPRGGWWKWKVTPHTLDVVLLYAKKGHGRRAGIFTDFTFGVRAEEGFVPVASAYSGLTDAEFREVDRWIRRHITERFGPVRGVEPGLVFEIAFEGIRASRRHRSGVALRFPRMKRWRRDLSPKDADSLDTVRALLREASP